MFCIECGVRMTALVVLPCYWVSSQGHIFKLHILPHETCLKCTLCQFSRTNLKLLSMFLVLSPMETKSSYTILMASLYFGFSQKFSVFSDYFIYLVDNSILSIFVYDKILKYDKIVYENILFIKVSTSMFLLTFLPFRI